MRRQHVSAARVRAPSLSQKTVFRAPYVIRRAKTHKYTVSLQGPVEHTDAATVYVDIQVTSADVFEPVDAASIYVDIQPSGTELRESVDSAEIYIDIQNTGGECFSAFHFVGEMEATARWSANGTQNWSTDDNQRWSAVFAGQETAC